MTTEKSVAEKLLSQEIMDQVSKQGAVNALEAVYSKARYARFTRVKWGGNFHEIDDFES